MSIPVTGAVGVRRHLLLLLIGVGLCLLQPSAAAALPEAPTIPCRVTREADGTFRYQLSRPPAQSTCGSGWEDENKTVIGRNKDFDKNLVQLLTNQSIVTRSCWDHLHYTEDCPGVKKWSESHCRVDCKNLSEQFVSPQPTATSPAVTPPETWCQDRLACGLGIGFGIFGVVGLLGLIIWCIRSKWCKCTKRMDEII